MKVHAHGIHVTVEGIYSMEGEMRPLLCAACLHGAPLSLGR
jgi:hypothetical protein